MVAALDERRAVVPSSVRTSSDRRYGLELKTLQ